MKRAMLTCAALMAACLVGCTGGQKCGDCTDCKDQGSCCGSCGGACTSGTEAKMCADCKEGQKCAHCAAKAAS